MRIAATHPNTFSQINRKVQVQKSKRSHSAIANAGIATIVIYYTINE